MTELEQKRKILADLVYMGPSWKASLKEVQDGTLNFLGGEEEIVLSRGDMISLLERYLRGEVSAEDIFTWADALEMREDVALGAADDASGDVFHAIYTLATPELEGDLVPSLARELLKKLGG